MTRYFALTVHLLEPRYHGSAEWPPAPARVFQALVAGAAQGRHVPDEAVRALTLLEGLAPPVISAPSARRGQRVTLFVPNNDLDAVGGDPGRVGEVRTKKMVQPHLLEGETSILYAWPLLDGLRERGSNELPSLADGLYQLGRGVDPAWAVGELLDDEQLAARLRAHRGTIHRPTSGDGSNELAVPTKSSLASLARRFDAALNRLRSSADGRSTDFVQPPKAHFAMIRYEGMPTFHLFELRSESEPARSSPWAAYRATSLIERVRDTAIVALSNALPDRKADVERVLRGRRPDGANDGPTNERVRFIPLPSIGHPHADQSIRRVLVAVPSGPLAEDDVLWALAGRPFFDPETGEIEGTTLAAATTDDMVARYRATARTWRSVTPLALGSAIRRRIEPTHQREEAKSATEREAEERAARHAVAQALRHAGITTSLVRARVQREPFDAHGTRAERFAEGTRFAKESLWHVEVAFGAPVEGPLLLGDGRFLGLGLMAPVVDIVPGVHAFAIAGGLVGEPDPVGVARALRRAVMARVQTTLGTREQLAPFFSGHAEDGAPLRRSRSSHLSFAFEPESRRLLILAPHVVERRMPTSQELDHLRTLDAALEGFCELRAGRSGVFLLSPAAIEERDDSLMGRSREWKTITPYVVTRHTKGDAAPKVLSDNVRAECRRLGLPEPRVESSDVRGAPGIGLTGNVTLIFELPVAGPLLLGRTRYLGGGLFRLGREPHEP